VPFIIVHSAALDGNLIEPGTNFLVDYGFIGALAGDGSQEVGYFWSEAHLRARFHRLGGCRF
jgi:hypothetical protein